MNSTASVLEPVAASRQEKCAAQKEVWRRYAKAGHGSSSENSLVEQYLPLVKTVAGRLAMSLPSHVNMDDLHSAGLIGLLNAIRRFDARSGSFESYARVRIRGAIFDELRRLDWVPRSIHDKAKKVEKFLQEHLQRTGSIPTDAEMGKAMNMTRKDYQNLLEEIRPATYVCLDSVSGNDNESGSDSHEVIADDSQVNPGISASLKEMARLIEDRISQLPEMQRKVLALYYFEDLRLREIAEAFGVTESRICQIHSQAILAIKSLLRKQDPEVFTHPL
ncbi:MAG: FliA/WhiG family RNA polymerase sigma factor [Verrucomicrobiota bacterium]